MRAAKTTSNYVKSHQKKCYIGLSRPRRVSPSPPPPLHPTTSNKQQATSNHQTPSTLTQSIGRALTYADDPDFPSHKANHRQFLGDKSKFKEVVPISDPEVEKKIHQTYRLQYLKDVVLARILDDPTFSVLNSLIFFNQFDILQHLQSSPAFLKELFSIFHNPAGGDDNDDDHAASTASKKKLAILFIQNCCAIAKGIQAQARIQLYSHFIHHGLFGVIDYALAEKDASVRIAGTDILVAMIDHDPAMMRAFIYRQINEKQKPLTHTLIELLLGEQDLGVKAQIADAIRVLLDHSQGPLDSLNKSGADMAVRIHARSNIDNDTEGFLKTFYEESAKKLFAPLRELQSQQSQSRTQTRARPTLPSPPLPSANADGFMEKKKKKKKFSDRTTSFRGFSLLPPCRDALLLRPTPFLPE